MGKKSNYQEVKLPGHPAGTGRARSDKRDASKGNIFSKRRLNGLFKNTVFLKRK